MKTSAIIKTGLFAAVVSVLSIVSLPTQPVPFSLALVGVFITGALLPPREAFAACLCYLLLGAAGLPMFAGFRGGVQVLVGYTGGFLLSYPLMALTVSLSARSNAGKKIVRLITGMSLSLVICYVCGCLVYRAVSGCTVGAAVTVCVLPYLLFDIVKIIASAFFALAAEKAVKH